jgi:putative ATP-dependent endonuclease of the OLD family
MYLSSVEVCGYRASAQQSLTCVFPGRFSVLLGPNSGGKTTICDAIYLAHSKRFPTLPRPTSDSLGILPREIAVKFSFEDAGSLESELGQRLQSGGDMPPSWERRLLRDLGSVRSQFVSEPDFADNLLVLTLPATRNPLDELARRESRSLIELLRAEQQRRKNHRNLVDLRTAAEQALDALIRHPLLLAVEERIRAHLDFLTSGVEHQYAFVGRQKVDDAFLARVLELLLAVVDDRALAQRLELSGLGYVNLLHIAVTLAAIPGSDPLGDERPKSNATEHPDGESSTSAGSEPEEAAADNDDEEGAAIEDSFFPKDFLHATVIIEEPEAHLHPQLHRGLVSYLKRTVKKRPEVQVVLTTHSSEVVSACAPGELVVMRREEDGTRVCRQLADLPLSPAKKGRVLRMAQVHLDSSRSASLFAERVVLVEGVTDVMLLRQFARAWAGDNLRRLDRVEALTIVPIGSQVGEWPVQLLATKGYELAQRVALLLDTDFRGPGPDVPSEPGWISKYHDSARVKAFRSHPTLEPSVVLGNETHVKSALDNMKIDTDEDPTPESIDKLFLSPTKAGKAVGEPSSKHGRKAEFAFELAAVLSEALESSTSIAVPPHIADLFAFVTGENPPATVEPNETTSASEL